jgi:hypothetical protein
MLWFYAPVTSMVLRKTNSLITSQRRRELLRQVVCPEQLNLRFPSPFKNGIVAGHNNTIPILREKGLSLVDMFVHHAIKDPAGSRSYNVNLKAFTG